MGVMYLYNITWRGLACVAYPYLGAMRRPEHRDRRGGTTPTSFLFPKFCLIINAETGESDRRM